jgi:hypothetical protein
MEDAVPIIGPTAWGNERWAPGAANLGYNQIAGSGILNQAQTQLKLIAGGC